jgi:hypothetical protein
MGSRSPSALQPARRPVPWGLQPQRSPFVLAKGSSASKLSASSEPTRHDHQQRARGLVASGAPARCFAARRSALPSRPAARSPSGSSPEACFPFSAVSAASPFLGAAQPRSLAAKHAGRGFASPAAFPPSGFLTLLTAFSSRRLVGLFRPTGTPGVVRPPNVA